MKEYYTEEDIKNIVKDERVKLMQVVYWLSNLYQINWETFSPHVNPDAPEWKREAYMNFSTVQGTNMRQLVERLSKEDIDEDLFREAIKDLTLNQ